MRHYTNRRYARALTCLQFMFDAIRFDWSSDKRTITSINVKKLLAITEADILSKRSYGKDAVKSILQMQTDLRALLDKWENETK